LTHFGWLQKKKKKEKETVVSCPCLYIANTCNVSRNEIPSYNPIYIGNFLKSKHLLSIVLKGEIKEINLLFEKNMCFHSTCAITTKRHGNSYT
jgi:hypothetical protein